MELFLKQGRDRHLKGSMTVFMGMTILAILSIFFSLLEVVHYYSLKKEAVMVTSVGAESLMADYCRPLWDEYELLGIDGGFGGSSFLSEKAEERTLGYLTENLVVDDNAGSANHLGMDASECKLDSYELITDNDGKAFVKECAEAALMGIPDDVMDKLKDNGDAALDAARDENDIDSMLKEGKDATDNAKESPTEGSEATGENKSHTDPDHQAHKPEGGLSDAEAAAAGNPIETILEWKNKGVLAQVLPSDVKYSESAFGKGERLSKRTLNKGNVRGAPKVSAAEWTLFHYYLMDRFSCYTKDRGRKGIRYELEYIISGKEDDESNLAAAVEKLLAIRSAVNLSCIARDERRLLEAESVAWAIAGYTGNPVIIKAVKAGIVAAWVYVESVLDVRTLLAKGKVPAVKTPAQWNSEIMLLPNYLDASVRSKESAEGIDYLSCLTAMLACESKSKIAMRALDLIENEIGMKEDYHNVKLDNFICRAKISCTYEGSPVFGSLATVGTQPGGYVFEDEQTRSYIKE